MAASPCAGRSTPPRKNVSSVKSRIGLGVPRMWTTNCKRSSLAATTNSVNQTNTKERQTLKSKKSVFCIAPPREQADRIVGQLKTANFSNNDISVLFPDKGTTRDFAHEKNTKAPEGAVTGAGTGGVIGGALGWIAGIGALAIPGVGPFIAAGPIIAALSGAAVGAAVGGIAGGLIGLG